MKENNAQNGGAIFNNGAVVNDIETDGDAAAVKTFTENSAQYNVGTEEEPVWVGEGGVIFNSGGAITLTGAALKDNDAVDSGGAIHNLADGTVTLTDVTLSGNTAPDGGAIYNLGAVTIDGGTVSGNSADNAGGVIFSTDTSAVTIDGGMISGNTAPVGGVVYADSGVTVTVKGGEISGNSANTGGVIYSTDTSAVTIRGGTISDNTATVGGAVYADSGVTVTVKGGEISGNSADAGGVIYSTDQSAVTVDGGTFSGNSAINGGVFFTVAESTVTINGGTFGGSGSADGNSAHYGGVLYLLGTTANILGGSFAGNDAAYYGGACYMTNHNAALPSDDGSAVVNIDGGSFAGNTAMLGGAFYVNYDSSVPAYSATLNLGTVTMADNSAINGGAIANRGGTIVDLDTTAVKKFTGNAGKYNGGTEDDPVWIGNGGAIFNSGLIVLTNAEFTGNYCVGNGGAIDNLDDGLLTLFGAKFSDNSALAQRVSAGDVDWTGVNTGAGGAIQNWESAAIVNSYFTGNSAHDGGAIANGAGATLTLSQTAASDPDNDAPLGFSGNGAVYGGAIINVGTLTRAEGEETALEFAGNFSYNNGGAISNTDNNGTATGGKIDLYGVSFTNNTAGSTSKAGSGGAIISRKALTITDSTFTGNSAGGGGKGGAIDQIAGNLVLTGDTFTGNSAPNTGFGGAVNTWTGGAISNCAFDGNSARNGGAVSVLGNDTPATITDTSFSGNNAAFCGGALYASGTVEIDGATISGNTATLGGGVLTTTADISATQKGRGNVTFTGDVTTFSGNVSKRIKYGERVGNDICATSTSSADGSGAVFEIETMPSFGTTDGCAIGVDRSIIVLAEGLTLPDTVSIRANKEFTCGYTYNGSALAFTSLVSRSGIDTWRVYWSDGSSTDYTDGDPLPSGIINNGEMVLIESFGVDAKGNNYQTTYYLMPTVNAGGSGTSEALLDEALFDDAEVFEGLVPSGSALDEYCDECFL